jgi:hypothetical protein
MVVDRCVESIQTPNDLKHHFKSFALLQIFKTLTPTHSPPRTDSLCVRNRWWWKDHAR